MEEYTILKTGYNIAIRDILPYINNELEKDDILRRQAIYNGANKEYKGKQSKYWDKENNMGYVIFEDIFGIIGIMIDLESKIKVRIKKDEIDFVKQNLNENIFKIYECLTDIEKDIEQF